MLATSYHAIQLKKRGSKTRWMIWMAIADIDRHIIGCRFKKRGFKLRLMTWRALSCCHVIGSRLSQEMRLKLALMSWRAISITSCLAEAWCSTSGPWCSIASTNRKQHSKAIYYIIIASANHGRFQRKF